LYRVGSLDIPPDLVVTGPVLAQDVVCGLGCLVALLGLGVSFGTPSETRSGMFGPLVVPDTDFLVFPLVNSYPVVYLWMHLSSIHRFILLVY
jgi:hypothetical protein